MHDEREAAGLDMQSVEELRVQIASDLHLEMYEHELPALEELLQPSAPVLALLGDISALGNGRGMAAFEALLSSCHSRWEQVLFIPGNHEFYSIERGANRRTVGDVMEYLRSLSLKWPNVRLLDNEAITIGGVRVVGATLWSHVPPCQTVDGPHRQGEDATSTVEFRMNDYRQIFIAPEPGKRPRELTAHDTNSWHQQALAFIDHEVAQATEKHMNVLMLTHHTPSFVGTSDPKYPVDALGFSSGFSSDLHYMLHNPRLAALHTWCFGHTHWNSDRHVHGVRLVSNQHGYHFQKSARYKTAFVVKVPRNWVQRQVPSSRNCPSKCTIT